jgi:hypothetical protein
MINDPSEWRWTMPETHAPEMCELDIAELEVVSGGDGVNGGQNKNKAIGFGPTASQQVFIGAQ